MYLDEQLTAFIKENKKHSAILYFDATGSLIQKIPGQDKRIFLYSLVMKNPVEGKSALPIAEFLSNDHHTSEIKHFLGFLLNQLKALSSKVIPRQVETDLSWAIIQGVLQSINEHNAREYLEFVWNVIGKKFSNKELKSKVFIHICSAHILQIFIRTLELKSCSKMIKDLILRSLCSLLNCTSMEEARDIFSHICDVLIPEKHTSQVEEGLRALSSIIKKTQIDDELESLEDFNLEYTEKEVEEGEKSLLKRSKFYR